METIDVTPEEEEKILNNVFSSLEPLKLKVISSKAKKKAVIFKKIAGQFEKGKHYKKRRKRILAQIKGVFAGRIFLQWHWKCRTYF